MSLLAEKFSYCLPTRLKVLCFHSASLTSTPEFLRRRSMSLKVKVWGMENRGWPWSLRVVPGGEPGPVASTLLLHSPLLELPQPHEWAIPRVNGGDGFIHQTLTETYDVPGVQTQVKEGGDEKHSL